MLKVLFFYNTGFHATLLDSPCRIMATIIVQKHANCHFCATTPMCPCRDTRWPCRDAIASGFWLELDSAFQAATSSDPCCDTEYSVFDFCSFLPFSSPFDFFVWVITYNIKSSINVHIKIIKHNKNFDMFGWNMNVCIFHS